MQPLIILNDVHLGVNRSAGTTPVSALKIKEYVQDVFQNFLLAHKHHDILILGDMFDGFTMDASTILEAYRSLAAYLLAGGKTLHLVPGNHDWSAKGDKVSSFHMLSKFLQSRFPSQVVIYEPEFNRVRDNIYTIPHCANQDLFELELQKAYNHDLKLEGDRDKAYLLLHCNVMNPFADKSDHSLNLTDEWSKRLAAKFDVIVAHEHQSRSVESDPSDPHSNPIYVLGNQWPTSIADCLNNDAKFAHVIKDGGVERITTWEASSDIGFCQVDWQEISQVSEDAKFIRITGKATSAEAPEVISMIAKFRSKSEAFVITNAVTVEGVGDMGEMAQLSLEQIQSFDVMKALLDLLDPDERTLIQEVMSKND